MSRWDNRFQWLRQFEHMDIILTFWVGFHHMNSKPSGAFHWHFFFVMFAFSCAWMAKKLSLRTWSASVVIFCLLYAGCTFSSALGATAKHAMTASVTQMGLLPGDCGGVTPTWHLYSAHMSPIVSTFDCWCQSTVKRGSNWRQTNVKTWNASLWIGPSFCSKWRQSSNDYSIFVRRVFPAQTEPKGSKRCSW